jgi:hypothetical protein
MFTVIPTRGKVAFGQAERPGLREFSEPVVDHGRGVWRAAAYVDAHAARQQRRRRAVR